VEATGEPTVERLQLRRGRGLGEDLVLGGSGLGAVLMELARALPLHASGPGSAFAGLALGEHLRPPLELSHHGGDALEETLLGGELRPVPDLEGCQLPPERLALQLQLRHLVPERIELGQQALEALANGGCGEDDGGGADAGHGGEARVYRTSSRFRPLARAEPGRRSALVRVAVPLLVLGIELRRSVTLRRGLRPVGHRRRGRLALRSRAPR
jgi:hypothetical protein